LAPMAGPRNAESLISRQPELSSAAQRERL
jgi:hypothetical protein